MYDPQAAKKRSVSRQIKTFANAQNWIACKTPCQVDIIFNEKAPNSGSKALKNSRLWGYSRHTNLKLKGLATKKDIDNYLKFIFDCGNGILWADDHLITRLVAKKQYSNNPCTIITVKPINGVKMTPSQQNVFETFSPDDIENLKFDMFNISIYGAECVESNNEAIEQQQMATTANNLIDFANKWADKFKKVKTKENQ